MIYAASLYEYTEDKMSGKYPIRTREELDRIVADTTTYNRVELHSSFIEENFTPSGVEEYIKQSKRINPNLIFEIAKDARRYTPSNYTNRMMNARDIDELIMIAVQNPTQFMSAFKGMLEQVRDAEDDILSSNALISKQQETIDIQQNSIFDIKRQLDIERRNHEYTRNTLNILLGRINNQYGMGIDKSKLLVTDHSNYTRVIYIKEATRVQHTDSLVYYLSEILKITYGTPVRSIVIEPYYATQKVSQYSNFKYYTELSEQDVMSEDILMLGMQPKLMQNIMNNPSNVSFIIILDRGGYVVPHVICKEAEYFYTMSDLKDRPSNVPLSRVISYSKETFNIPFIKEFDVMDPTEKVSAYSSMPVVKAIVKLLGV